MAIDALGSDGLAAALRSVQARGNATPIVPLRGNPYQPFAGTYEGGPRGMLPQHTPGVGQGGGGQGGGASGAGAGLEKLGAGVAQAMKGFAAKSAQQKQFNDMLGGLPGRSTFGGPATSSAPLGGAASPSPVADSPLSAPYTPSPIGEAGPIPSFAQGAAAGETGTSIGPGGPLPTFAAGPGAADSMAKYRGAIASIESAGSGDYSALNSRTGATGRYQVMPSNIPVWTKDALGAPMTQKDFLANPKAQDAVFDHIFGGYVDKYGPSGAANMWFTGKPNPPATANDGSTTAPQYVSRFNNALGAPSQPTSPVGAAAYAAMPPSAAEQAVESAQSSVITGQGDPHKGGFDENAVKFHDYHPEFSSGPTPGPQSMNEVPSGDMGANQERGYFTNFQGMSPGDEMPKSLAPLPERQFPTGPGNLGVAENDQSFQQMLAAALAQNNQFDFGNFGSGFGGNLFG